MRNYKLNVKAARGGSAIEWHQDWAYYPHTNDSLLAVGIFLDDMTADNGPLCVFPGTHRGPTLNHHNDAEMFVGGISDLGAAGLDPASSVRLMGRAGSISCHHVRLVHGSGWNGTSSSRNIVFLEVAAADAFPLMAAHQPLFFDDETLLCGRPTLAPRIVPAPLRLPVPVASGGTLYERQRHMDSFSFGKNFAR